MYDLRWESRSKTHYYKTYQVILLYFSILYHTVLMLAKFCGFRTPLILRFLAYLLIYMYMHIYIIKYWVDCVQFQLRYLFLHIVEISKIHICISEPCCFMQWRKEWVSLTRGSLIIQWCARYILTSVYLMPCCIVSPHHNMTWSWFTITLFRGKYF